MDLRYKDTFLELLNIESYCLVLSVEYKVRSQLFFVNLLQKSELSLVKEFFGSLVYI